MKKTSFILLILTLISGLFGFGRDIVLAYLYGASSISDLYIVSLTIPVTMLSIIMMGITTGYIPIYSELSESKGYKKGADFTSNLLNLVIFLSTIIFLIGIIFTEELVRIFASGFTGKILDMTILFTRITLFSVYFSGAISIFTAYLQIKGKFYLSSLFGIITNIITILFIVVSEKYSVYFLPVGGIVALGIQFLTLYILAKKNGFYFQFKFNVYDENIKKILVLSLPLIIGVAFNQINIIIDRTLASRIVEGGIASLTFANRINIFLSTLITTSVASVTFPTLSKLAAKNDIVNLKKIFSDSLIFVMLLIVPATIGVLFFSKEIIELLFNRGKFSEDDLFQTSTALFMYSVGMISICVRDVTAKVFYALQDTKTPMINGTIAVLINIMLNIILSKYMGVSGLALATSISGIICGILLIYSLKTKIGNFNLSRLFKLFIRILIVSILTACISKQIYFFFLISNTIIYSLSFTLIIGMLLYIVFVYYLQIKELNDIYKYLLKKVKLQ